MRSSARPKGIERFTAARTATCVSLVIASASGCKLTPQDQNASSAVAPPSAHAPRTFLVPGHSALGISRVDSMAPPEGDPAEDVVLQWTKPDGWDDVPVTGSMRLATYRIHHAKDDTEDAEMSVTQVGGDVESNISRWVNQFEEKPTPSRKEFHFDQIKATVVKLSGTYTGGGMQGAAPQPKPNMSLLAIIVETGGEPYFFKMTGPTGTVSAASEGFSNLVKSLRLAPRESVPQRP